jgi:retinol dehydrogenase 12
VVGEIRAEFPASKRELVNLHLDLEDLIAIKASAEEFLGKEDRLDVMWNNAAVMKTLAGLKAKQGHELQLRTGNTTPFFVHEVTYASPGRGD